MSTIKLYACTLILLCSANQCLGLIKAYFPPSSNSTYPHLSFGRVPELNEFTFCSWIRLLNKNRNKFPHVFSYATNVSDNEIAVYMNKQSSECVINALQVRDIIAKFNCCFVDWSVTSWHHICASWFSGDGSTKYYLDGQRCSAINNTYISSGAILPGGGVAVLGQDQDHVGHGFVAPESWNGDIAGVNLWREVLSENQMMEAGKCSGKRKPGTVFAWSKSPMAGYHGIVISEAEVCEP